MRQSVPRLRLTGQTTLTFSELIRSSPSRRCTLGLELKGPSTNDPTSINAILFEGTSCVPHTVNPFALNCTIGAYPTMSVNVTTVAQIQLAINLARSLNLRLVIKNTGHDYSAKSTGAGALSLWTHNMKDIQYYERYEEGSYRGLAFKMAAGVQVFEAYEAAHKYNLTIVGAEGKVRRLLIPLGRELTITSTDGRAYRRVYSRWRPLPFVKSIWNGSRPGWFIFTGIVTAWAKMTIGPLYGVSHSRRSLRHS